MQIYEMESWQTDNEKKRQGPNICICFINKCQVNFALP